MRCKKCKTKNDSKAVYCSNCGEPLEKRDKKKTVVIVSMIVIILIAIIGGIFLANTKIKEKEYQDKIETAQRYVEEKEYEKAEETYLEAIDIEPKKSQAYVELADVYVEQDEYDQALEIIEKAIENVVDEDLDEVKKKKDSIEQLANNKEFTDEDFLEILKQSVGNENIFDYIREDFDGDGNLEMFAFTGDYDGYLYGNVKIYFVSKDGEVSFVASQPAGILSYDHEITNKYLNADKFKFIVWEETYGGSGSTSYIYGVKDGMWYELDLSGQYQGFRRSKEDYDGFEMFVGFESDFSNGYHDWIPVGIMFDYNQKEFILTGELAWKDSY